MSADNYTKCPKCLADIKANKAKLAKKLETEYGKMPIEEFRELASQVDEPIFIGNSLREDYEFCMDEDGELSISYSCRCKCGFSFDYKNTVVALTKQK